MADIDNFLNYLLTAKHDYEIISSLRYAKEFLLLSAKATWFRRSFIPYALSNSRSLIDCLDVIV